ncbi:L,D-transpeptidase family protein [Pararhodobacter zhoushanensis]|uniref:L,D-transpeptidase family protein n=1 Tax=Pararhodobacter zhoushanensis TaxID=2479545 RepID=A0ABT3GUJ9_9RHOB|nr:L,D-transpeptidase family protein [Pararhodobacter zhoushanensis]MCW1931214.1 L,D-transpeptidase family protein [Pararhodobacter zhoushanensis]
MTNDPFRRLSRRGFLAGSAALGGTLAAPAVWAQTAPQTNALNNSTQMEADLESTPRNISSFRTLEWRDYFSNLQRGAILADTESRCVHFWSEDGGTYRLYPSPVPMTDELTRRGRTEIVRKVVGPDWRPTPSMLERYPDWPPYVPPGPDNPLGTHALYLSWQFYRIHGTHDTRKIGRRSSSGCIGLYNEHIAELYSFTRVGTQVLLI